MRILQITLIISAINFVGEELKAEEINWGQSINAGQTSNSTKPKIESSLPGVSKGLFDASNSKPKMICLGGRWVATSPYGSTNSENTKWNCVGGVLTPDPNQSSETLQ